MQISKSIYLLKKLNVEKLIYDIKTDENISLN